MDVVAATFAIRNFQLFLIMIFITRLKNFDKYQWSFCSMYVSEFSLVDLIVTLSRFQFRLYIDSFCIFRLHLRKLSVPYQQWGIPSARILLDTLIESLLLFPVVPAPKNGPFNHDSRQHFFSTVHIQFTNGCCTNFYFKNNAFEFFKRVISNLSKQRVYLSVKKYAIWNEYKRIVALISHLNVSYTFNMSQQKNNCT